MRTEKQIAEYYENLATDYIGQAQQLRCLASVHLENKADERYWDAMLQQHRPGKYNYLYHGIHHDGNQTSGCSQCLQFRNYLSGHFFICIDSDYRHLRQEPGLDPQHYINQTYTYSWENHYCHAERLQKTLHAKGVTLAERFDFSAFLHEYSSTIYEPLLLFLYMDRNEYRGFGQKKFNEISALQYRAGDLKDSGSPVIERLSIALTTFATPLKSKYNFDFESEKNYYAALGVTEENAYLHFRGHNLYNIVRSLGNSLCKNSGINFEQDVLLDNLAFDTYWEIEKSGQDLKALQ
ncbi:DUF4435 domain-containing protein [Bacteroides sp.]